MFFIHKTNSFPVCVFVIHCAVVVSFVFLYKYEMILPLTTALLVAQRSVAEVFGELIISVKDAHFLLK